MVKTAADIRDPAGRLIVAGLVGWLVPGAGHWFVGERNRAVILMVVIAVTFWTGVAVGGVRNTVNPSQRSLWFAGQVCAGSHAFVAVGLGRLVSSPRESGVLPNEVVAFGRAEDIAVVYTTIAGMLNAIMILDVLVRAEKLTPQTAGARRGPPGKAKRKGKSK